MVLEYNNFFIIDKYYIYVYDIKYNYDFKLLNNDLYLICNFDFTIKHDINIKIKIMYETKEYIFTENNLKSNIVNIGNINNLPFENIDNKIELYNINKNMTEINNDQNNNDQNNNDQNNNDQNNNEIINKIKNYIVNDIISINNNFLEKNIKLIYPNFNIKYYLISNSYITNKYDKKYLLYHWYFFGRHNGQLYFKYLLFKYSEKIKLLKYNKIIYSEDKNNTLLFIDDRYDPSFIYILQLFLYSINHKWNITLYTTEDNVKNYQSDFQKLDVSAKIIILNKKFKNINDYSKLLKNPNFWENIKEDNCLLFQYDSFCMGKFDKKFLNYNYIGARWNHSATILNNICIGNGGTSFRKTRIMEYICKKYEKREPIKNYPEDVFFSHLLYEEKLHNCNNFIADKFSFENIYNENSIYAHQIYKVIKIEDMDNFIDSKITKMLDNSNNNCNFSI